jgi:S-adenosylmethionine:tRNA-ribosyltransferase-isomerase (queuine synthetase)
MHAEWGRMTPPPRIASTPCAPPAAASIAVGTTSLRLLESAAGKTA